MARPSLAALEAFLAVTRHGSFRRAAVERRVTPSALSHVIRNLEASLDLRLFNRTSRSVSLTEAGRQLADRVGPALSDVERALDGLDALRDAGTAGLLQLNMPRIATQLLMEPVVVRFLAAYPQVRLEITTSDGLVDIVAERFDAGIRRDRRLAPGMVAVPMGPPRRFAVVGSPAYLAQNPAPHTPQDLRGHACIERRFPDGSRYAWEFARGGEVLEVDVSGPLTVDDTALMLRAALDGVGLALVFESLVADHIDAGRLVRLLEAWCPPRPRFYLYYTGRRQVPAPLRAFIDMVREEAGRA